MVDDNNDEDNDDHDRRWSMGSYYKLTYEPLAKRVATQQLKRK